MKDLQVKKTAILLIMSLCLGLFFINMVQAADKNKLTGKITDAYTGVPLAGATVQIKGTDIKTETAKDGTYSLDLTKDAKKIIIEYTGYKSLEIEIKGRNVINSVLSPAGNTNTIWG